MKDKLEIKILIKESKRGPESKETNGPVERTRELEIHTKK